MEKNQRIKKRKLPLMLPRKMKERIDHAVKLLFLGALELQELPLVNLLGVETLICLFFWTTLVINFAKCI